MYPDLTFLSFPNISKVEALASYIQILFLNVTNWRREISSPLLRPPQLAFPKEKINKD
jgi:hypothetical protein